MKTLLLLLLLSPVVNAAETKVTNNELKTNIVSTASCVSIAEQTFTQTSMVTALTGSTNTLTTSGGDVWAFFSGNVSNSVSGYYVFVTMQIDGVNYETTKPIVIANVSNGNNVPDSISFIRKLNPIAAGPHSFNLVMSVQGNTGKILNSSGVGNNGGNQFCVVELR